jgi:hypothetical protein
MKEGWLHRRYLWYLRRQKVLEARSRRSGACARCGRCCQHCPFHNAKRGECRIYRLRPDICRMFPLVPEDIRHIKTCGYSFKDNDQPAP